MATDAATIPTPELTVSLDAASVESIATAVAERCAALIPEPDRWLTSEEAAAYLAIPYSTFRKHTAAGRIRGEQDIHNGRLYFHPDDLDEWRRRPPE